MDKNETKRQLNIAMLGQKHVPSREGGVEVVVEELAVRETQRGHHVTCYNRSSHSGGGHKSGRRTRSEYRGVTLIDVPTIDRRGLAAATASVSASVLAMLGSYDVVHYHAEGPAFMCWLPKLRGKRVIVTIHGLDHQRAKWGWFARHYIKWGEQAAVRWADEIIVLSRNLQQYFQELYGRRTVFIPNGVNRPEPRPASIISERYGLTKGSYILFLGRLVPEKGLMYLAEAFQQVKTDRRLVITGRSADTDQFGEELRKKCSADQRILFTGFAQGELLEELFSNAYVYVLPSDVEGMPLSLLEAMSYGNCCLVSDIPECTEVVEDHAAVFRRGDTADLARYLQELCDHPETVESYRSGAADYICGRYDWEQVTEQTLALYRADA